MTKTVNYQLNQWESTDKISRADFNSDNAAIDGLLAAAERRTAAAQAAGDRGLDGLRKMMGDVCRLAYQADGKGIYTGFRQGFDFDGLNADHKVESTTGAAVLEPDNGQVRLAVDGWTGGTVAWDGATSLSLPTVSSGELLSAQWSPEGAGLLNAATITGTISAENTINSSAEVYAILMQGEQELAISETKKLEGSECTVTLTFSAPGTMLPDMKYHLRIVFINSASNRVKSATVTDSITLTATGVRMTTGSFVSGPIALAGAEIQAWVQYSDPGVLDIEVLQNDEWVSAALVREGDSQTPDGTACKERTYSLILTKAVDSVQVRVNLNSESECYVYGYGVMAL